MINEFLSRTKQSIRDKVKVALDFLNDASKKELEHAPGIDASDLAAKKDFIALKSKLTNETLTNWIRSQLIWIN